jgi:hypothetical protein
MHLPDAVGPDVAKNLPETQQASLGVAIGQGETDVTLACCHGP